MIRRHPFLFCFLSIMVIIFCVVGLVPDNTKSEHLKLDYSKPVYTNDSAIICPQSLFYDLRADHDANAIFGAFTAIFDRDAKVKAIGCERLKGDIPVTAHRMPAPYNNFVSIGLFGSATSDYFTMEGYLKNDVMAQAPTSLQNSSGAMSARSLRDYERDRIEFQSRMETLAKPGANLRWFSKTGTLDFPTLSLLVTPYGPCIILMGKPQAYGVLTMDSNPHGPAPPSDFLGTFDSADSATTMADKYCDDWYRAQAIQTMTSIQAKHLWFPVDLAGSPDTTTNMKSNDGEENEVQPKPTLGEQTPQN